MATQANEGPASQAGRKLSSAYLSPRELIAIAGWAGALFGVAEGAVLTFTRQFPTIVAPYKTSPHVIWIAPTLNIVLFGVVAILLVAITRIGRRGQPRAQILGSVGGATFIFVFLGAFGILTAPEILHPASAVVLGAGVAVVAKRFMQDSERLLAALQRRAMVVPLIPLSLGIGTSAALAIGNPNEAPRRPGEAAINVLLVVLDTVRRDHFAWAGDRSYTPNLDRLVARGVRYDDAWSVSSWSLPTQASMLTGLAPEQHGADWPALALSPHARTLGEYFGERGYKVGAFSSNSSWITPEYLGRGFQVFDAYTLEDHLRRTAFGRLLSRASVLVGLHYAGRGRRASDLNARITEFIDRDDLPFFAFVCYMDVNRGFHKAQLGHPFWRAAPPVDVQVAAYREGLRELDAEIGRLLLYLERRGSMQNTIVVVTSDHGESFGDGHDGDRDPAGHGTSLFPEQTRVPLFVFAPSAAVKPASVTTTVSIQSIPATVAFLTGDGRSPFPGAILPGVGPGSSDPTAGAALSTLRYGERDWTAVARDGWEYVRERRDGAVRELLIQTPVRGDSARQEPPLADMRTLSAALTRGHSPAGPGK